MAKNRKKLKIREKIEIEVAEILNEFIYSHKDFNSQSTMELLKTLEKYFNLQTDPFTYSYVSSVEYGELMEEYNRQLEEIRYG